jgi:uncharacterized membrane protein
MDLKFLKSERFWAIVINAVVLYLQQKGWIGTSELALITAIVGPFVLIGTVDRVGKNIGGVSPAVTTQEEQE